MPLSLPQNPLALSTASSSRNYRGINLWLQPPKAFLQRYRMICWTVLSSERFNEKKPRVPACIRVGVCPFPNLSILFSVCASLLGCWDMHDGVGCFVVVAVFKSLTLQKVGQSSQFQRKMRRGSRRRRELQISQGCLSVQIILPAVEEVLAWWAEQRKVDPVDEDKEQHWTQKGEGEEKRIQWLGRSLPQHPALCDKGGFYSRDAAMDTPLCALQRHWGLGKER